MQILSAKNVHLRRSRTGYPSAVSILHLWEQDEVGIKVRRIRWVWQQLHLAVVEKADRCCCRVCTGIVMMNTHTKRPRSESTAQRCHHVSLVLRLFVNVRFHFTLKENSGLFSAPLDQQRAIEKCSKSLLKLSSCSVRSRLPSMVRCLHTTKFQQSLTLRLCVILSCCQQSGI